MTLGKEEDVSDGAGELGAARAYVELDCLGVRRRFLLDSGCDLTIMPTSYVRGVQLTPIVREHSQRTR